MTVRRGVAVGGAVGGRPAGVAIALAVLVALASRAPADGPETTEDQNDRARLIGVVEGTEMAVSFKGTPAREAFRAIASAIDVPISGRWADDRIGHGLDPGAEIWLDVERADARFILEMMLEQCEDYEPCTWQLRRGYVEVGTKERLGAPSARQTRLYPMRDLMIEAPYFASDGGVVGLSRGAFLQRKYATAVISVPSDSGRKRPEELALEIVHGIVETVEPGNWDTGEPPEPDDDTYDSTVGGGGAAGAAPRRSTRRRVTQGWKIARIRQFRDQLIVTAPDFVHRQVGGYPQRRPAPSLTDEERATRSAQASSHDTVRVVVLVPERSE